MNYDSEQPKGEQQDPDKWVQDEGGEGCWPANKQQDDEKNELHKTSLGYTQRRGFWFTSSYKPVTFVRERVESTQYVLECG